MTRWAWWSGSGRPSGPSCCRARSYRAMQVIPTDFEFIPMTKGTNGRGGGVLEQRRDMVRTMCRMYFSCSVQDELEGQDFLRKNTEGDPKRSCRGCGSSVG